MSADNLKLKHICEVCGRTEILTSEEADLAGWDYPPFIGSFGVVSPRTCPNCSIFETLWAQLVLKKKQVSDLSEAHLVTLNRILCEPESLSVNEEEGQQ